jgi:hypothetical protein
MMRGEVHIAPVAQVPAGSMIDPETGLFFASWQEPDRALEDIELVGADAAILWGRARAETVIIRLGHRHNDFFSAGDSLAEGEGGPLPTWPPSTPQAGWWTPPRLPSMAEVEQVEADVAAGKLSADDAARWAQARLDPAIIEEAPKDVTFALARLASTYEVWLLGFTEE